MAVIPVEYWFSENNRKRTLVFDDVAGTIGGGQGAIVDPSQATKAVGELIYSDAQFEVYAQREVPYAFVKRTTGCSIPLPSLVSLTTAKNLITGNFDITIDYLNATAVKLLGIAGNPDSPTTSLLSSPKVMANYPAGQYVLILYSPSSSVCLYTEIFTVVPDLEASASGTGETAAGLSDGEINVTVTNGSGQYRVDYPDDATFTNLTSGSNPQSTTKTGLAPGTYDVLVTDLVSGQELEFEITITSGLGEIPPGSILQVPLLNSLHFVIKQTPDGCSIFQGLDNVLFCEQRHPYFAKGYYNQKVCKCDPLPIQFNSDFQNYEAHLRDYLTGSIIKSFTIELKEQNIGKKDNFLITIRAHTEVGKSRVYFNVGTPPVPLAIGQSFEILNNLDGFNGNYLIVDLLTDTTLGVPYIVINKNYSIIASSTAATGRFDVTTVNFNVYEFLMTFLDVVDGIYYVTIKAFDDDDNQKTATSEPVDLKVEHPDTNIIVYRSNDNAFDMTWTTGITCRIRVESVLFKRLPGGERSVSRNSDFSLVKVAAKKTRVVLFETYMLPPYLHEKLSVIFDCDFFTVQNVQFQTSEGYGEPTYITRYKLANSQVKLEQVGWFDRYNSDDIGSVAEGGYILIGESGFLKR